MYSPIYKYINIYADESLSKYVQTKELMSFLSTLKELEHKGKGSYKNRDTFPFMSINLLNPKNIDGWSSNDFCEEKTTLIDVVFSRGDDESEVESILNKIALFLGWKIIEDD